uniref:TSA: Wollemia nobilis Ref_Wollemi_Transcript_14511_1723 transcribed RNA sequence n=1 Tax=Wollemia nobilis TaxID=56998 RepID=A0A0C9S6N1_9CONI
MAAIPRPPHAVVVSFPSQGHVNPLIAFAKLIAARGFFVTFVNTEWSERRMFRPPNDAKAVSCQLQQRGLQIRFLSIPDDLPPNHPRVQAICEYFHAMEKLGPGIISLLQSNANEAPPITCIVTDCFMACTHEVATALGVPRVVFWTYCASAAIALSHSRLLLDKRYIPIKVKEARRPENQITCLPGKIPPLWPTDLQTFYRVQDPSDPIFQVFLYESDIQNKADYVLVNVFEELEGHEAVEGLSKGYPALAIGPVFFPEFLEGTDSSVEIATSLWEENLDCLKWLEAQAPSSVLYVAFGSIAVMSMAQLHELALGLEASQQPFLWVIRPDIAEGKTAVLPEGFADRVKGRGMLVEWAPQLKVLSHPSVGAFLTHNGWNSTSESISLGVPMIGWPLWAEQYHNCRFAKEIWKIGMDFESRVEDETALVGREEVEKVVRAMMDGAKGKELRKNAARLKQAAMKAVMPGGSSYKNLDKFAQDMTARANSLFAVE